MKLVGGGGHEDVPKVNVTSWDIPGVGKVAECVDCKALILADQAIRCQRCVRLVFNIKYCGGCAALEKQILDLQKELADAKGEKK